MKRKIKKIYKDLFKVAKFLEQEIISRHESIQDCQAASVAVSSWTLVAISCERYYAICHPLRSRTWQTIHHAYKIIGCIWLGSIVCMAPIAIFSQLIPTSRQGLRKCREQWPEEAVGYERFYNIFLDLALLVLPLAVLCVAYILITRTLYMGIRDEKALIFANRNNNSGNSEASDGKMYTQITSEMKTPTVFHFNLSLRYHGRKATGCCANSSEMLQVVKTAKNSDTMSSISPPAVGHNYRRRGLCYRSSADTEREAEISLKDPKEEVTQQTQSSSQPKCNDEITLIGSGGQVKVQPEETNLMAAISKTRPPTQIQEFATKLSEEECSRVTCKRSTSVKSLNHKRTSMGGMKPDTDRASSVSLNAIPETHFNRAQYGHQSLNRKQLQRHERQRQRQNQTTELGETRKLSSAPSPRITESTLRRSNLAKNLESKKRVVKMLFVLVLEFFICWTPLYVINTVAMFIGPAIYEYVDYTTISFLQLLAYSSSCCNPITYCFMNASFRRAFVDTFRGMHLNNGNFWRKNSKAATNLSAAGNSIPLANSCTAVTANTALDSPRL